MWYWEGDLEYMWMYSICDSCGCPTIYINETIGCGSIELLMTSVNGLEFRWTWEDFELNYTSTDINDVEVGELDVVFPPNSWWFWRHITMIHDIWPLELDDCLQYHIRLICSFIYQVYRFGILYNVLVFLGGTVDNVKRGSRN